MTDAVRSSLAPAVERYLKEADKLEVSKWRQAALDSAGRVALIVSCDVEEAIAAMLRVKGFDEVADEQRAAVIRESPDAFDLFKFGLSEAFVREREALGLAIKKSK
jgi:hypothetical protein